MSLEGSVLLERKDANKKFYDHEVTARQLLGGTIPSPPAADALLRILNSRAFRGNAGDNSDMYNSSPVYEVDSEWDGRRGGGRRGSFDAPRRTSTWHDDVYDRGDSNSSPHRSMSTRRDPNTLFGRQEPATNNSQQFQRQDFQATTYSKKGPAPGRPTAPKPNFKAPSRAATMGANQAVALYTFQGDQEGDLSFKKVCSDSQSREGLT